MSEKGWPADLTKRRSINPCCPMRGTIIAGARLGARYADASDFLG